MPDQLKRKLGHTKDLNIDCKPLPVEIKVRLHFSRRYLIYTYS